MRRRLTSVVVAWLMRVVTVLAPRVMLTAQVPGYLLRSQVRARPVQKAALAPKPMPKVLQLHRRLPLLQRETITVRLRLTSVEVAWLVMMVPRVMLTVQVPGYLLRSLVSARPVQGAALAPMPKAL